MVQNIVRAFPVDNGLTKIAAIAFAEAANVVYNFKTYARWVVYVVNISSRKTNETLQT